MNLTAEYTEDKPDWSGRPDRYSGMNAGGGTPKEPEAEYKYFKEDGVGFDTSKLRRVVFDTGMVRDSSTNKTRWDLLVPASHPGKTMLQRWAELLTSGAKHYAPRNWEKSETPEEYDRFKESAIRHFMMWYMGIVDPDEPDVDHAAATFFNIEGAEYVKGRLVN